MRVVARRLKGGEVDYELVWLSASLTSLGIAVAWFTLGLPWPVCIFHEVTGLPCVTCGMTRCAIQFFHGHFLVALRWNPLIFTLLCGVIAFDLYAFATLTMRVPRLWISFSTQRAKAFVRLSVILVFALNWI